jgi:hypothetical protein
MSPSDFDIIVIPWPAYDETSLEPYWTVRIAHKSGQRGRGSYRLTWAQRRHDWVSASELHALMAKSPSVVRAAKAVVIQAIGG